MTAFEHIVAAILPLGYPYTTELYTGGAEKYFQYNYADERGTLFGDGEPGADIASVQVHFFLPQNENFITEKNTIRKRLFAEGFTYPEVTMQIDGKKRHIIFECEIDEMEE